ncbi:MAG: hypothetical protein D3911_07310, partial [Candidatus Electrothrix sp. AW3_4]|nr:hypothetical protein [Candidatus Electrothrix gigas]
EVENPGMFPYRPGLTALNACVMAGGFTESAAPERATIIRKKGEETLDEKLSHDLYVDLAVFLMEESESVALAAEANK